MFNGQKKSPSKMKRKRTPSCGSDDGRPRSAAKRRYVDDPNAYSSLVTRSRQHCDFCDEVFTDRLSCIVHNAKHIIIPLINQTVHQCTTCLFHFTSLQDLTIHTMEKHQKSLVIYPGYNQETLLEKYNGYRTKIPDILQSIVEKQVVVKCHDELRELQADYNLCPKTQKLQNGGSVKVTEKNFVPTFVISDSDEESLARSNIKRSQLTFSNERQSESHFKPVTLKETSSSDRELSSPGREPIRSRLLFEDDLDDDLFQGEEILPDLHYPNGSQNLSETYCKKNSFVFGTQFCNKDNSYSLGEEGTDVNLPGIDKCDRGNGVQESNCEMETYTPSVHYDELIQYNLVDCRYCGRCFGNRLELIQHETTHLRVRRPRPVLCCVCERYIAGNYKSLRKHISNKHPSEVDRKLKIQKCIKCHLRYHNYFKHIRYYHQVYSCGHCLRNFDKEQLEKHSCDDVVLGPNILTMDKYRVIKMCEICLSFVRNKQNIHYEVIGEHSEVGMRQQCEKCYCKFFEINLVRRKVTYREKDCIKARKKPVTNEARLKKMQNRLKQINKMNKC